MGVPIATWRNRPTIPVCHERAVSIWWELHRFRSQDAQLGTGSMAAVVRRLQASEILAHLEGCGIPRQDWPLLYSAIQVRESVWCEHQIAKAEESEQ